MLPKDKYTKIVRRPYPPFYTSLFMMGFRRPDIFSVFLNEPFSIVEMLYIESDWYLEY